MLCLGVQPGQADSDVLRKAVHRVSTQAQGGGVELGRAGDAGDGGVEHFLQLAAHGAQLAPCAVAVEPAAVLLPVGVLIDAGTACAQAAGNAGAGGFLFAAPAEEGRHGNCGHCCPTPDGDGSHGSGGAAGQRRCATRRCRAIGAIGCQQAADAGAGGVRCHGAQRIGYRHGASKHLRAYRNQAGSRGIQTAGVAGQAQQIAAAARAARGCIGCAWQAQCAANSDRNRRHHSLNNRAQHHRLEHVGDRVAHRLRKALAALKGAHQGVGQGVFNTRGGALPFGVGGFCGFYAGVKAVFGISRQRQALSSGNLFFDQADLLF